MNNYGWRMIELGAQRTMHLHGLLCSSSSTRTEFLNDSGTSVVEWLIFALSCLSLGRHCQTQCGDGILRTQPGNIFLHSEATLEDNRLGNVTTSYTHTYYNLLCMPAQLVAWPYHHWVSFYPTRSFASSSFHPKHFVSITKHEPPRRSSSQRVSWYASKGSKPLQN